MTDTTNAATAEAATESVPMDWGLTLIGTFGSENAPGALLRRRGGRVARVTPGDQIPGGRILAIEPGRVILSQQGETVSLMVPQSST